MATPTISVGDQNGLAATRNGSNAVSADPEQAAVPVNRPARCCVVQRHARVTQLHSATCWIRQPEPVAVQRFKRHPVPHAHGVAQSVRGQILGGRHTLLLARALPDGTVTAS